MAQIPNKTITLILLLKVFAPISDTWSDVLWIYKLFTFGNDWTEFNVGAYVSFLESTEDCLETQYKEIEESSVIWINKTVNLETYKSAISDGNTVTDEQWDEMISGQTLFESQPNTKARCKIDYTIWAYAAIIPVLIYLVFTIFVWWREEEGFARILLLPVVLCGIYSQYRAVKIILIGLGKWPDRHQTDWIEEKTKFTRETSSLEPTTEALPSLLIQVALVSTELIALIVGARPSPLVENPILFPFSFGLTILLTVMGLAHFLKDGPSPLITSKDGFLDGFVSIKFAELFFCIFFWFMSKCWLLVGVINSFAASSSASTSIARVRMHQGMGRGVLLWASLSIVPQLIHAVIVLAISTRTKLFSLCINFPSFIITPMFTPFTYKGSSMDDGKFEFCVSIKHSIINILISILITPLTMVLCYEKGIWEATYSFGLDPDYISSFQPVIDNYRNNNEMQAANNKQNQLDLEIKYAQFLVMGTVLLPFILLLLALIPAYFLLRTSKCSPCGQNGTGKFRNGIKFKKTGRIRWEVKLEKLNDFTVEMQVEVEKENKDYSEVGSYLLEEVSREEVEEAADEIGQIKKIKQ